MTKAKVIKKKLSKKAIEAMLKTKEAYFDLLDSLSHTVKSAEVLNFVLQNPNHLVEEDDGVCEDEKVMVVGHLLNTLSEHFPALLKVHQRLNR